MPTENQNADPATSLAAGHDLNQWKLVPVEPTETMVINGFESAPNECFSDEDVWDQYQDMSGCQQAAFRAKQCWAAMLAAAPAPDTHIAAPEESAGVDFGIDGRSVRVSQEAYSIFLAREAAGREKIAALQQRLTAADERADVLEGLVGEVLDAVGREPLDLDAVLRLRARMRAALKPAEGVGDDTTLEEDREDFKKVFVRINTKQGQSISLADMIARYEKKP
ncbi:hypothetical protein L9Z73_17440 [Pseudomonas sp. TNT11]|uniref:Uncharacterized protein n=1 Tax=Pseudomonas emilianonis TaxID=2915812 RepID=A0ABT0EK37_9PSED|nr:hypothetical protein [Pseudomonas emilianonis]MCK1786073.1 hypothetical protein [Pseudomonas emilianonis]